MNGYCGDCDEQIEFCESNIVKDNPIKSIVSIYLRCPWCENQELLTKVKVNNI